jgi:hypothetical protein
MTSIAIDTANGGTLFGRLCAVLIALLGLSAAQAQSSCSSDGQPMQSALIERFMGADCASCWTARVAQAGRSQLSNSQIAVDWIVPSAGGDDAPLSAAASRDALARLAALDLPLPAASLQRRSSVNQGGAASPSKPRAKPPLRVARGIALNGYLGASIELTLPPRQAKALQSALPLTAWLLLVEELPQGTEGSPVARLLVRNALVQTWATPGVLAADGALRWAESRPMSIAAGANPDRLRVVGWVEDARRRLVAVAASVCDHPK